MALLIYGCFLVLCLKKASVLPQLYQLLIGPIQVYICVEEIRNSTHQSANIAFSFYLVNLIISCLVIVVFSVILNVHYQSDSIKTINHVSWHYQFMVSINFVLLATLGLLIRQPALTLSLYFVINIIKSSLLYSKINYQAAQIQYCAILGDFASWITLIVLLISQTSFKNSIFLSWVNLFVFILLVFKKHKSISYLLENKYKRAILFVKQSLISDINTCHSRRTNFDQSLIIQMFIAFINITKHNQFSYNNWRKIRFDQSIFYEIFIILELFYRFQKIRQQENQSLKYRDGIRKRQTTHRISNDLPQETQFNQSNTNYQWDLIEGLSSKIQQVQDPKNLTIKNILIYQLPLRKVKTIYRLLQMHYLNVNFGQKSFLAEISEQMTYNYLTTRIFSENKKNINRKSGGVMSSILKEGKNRILNFENLTSFKKLQMAHTQLEGNIVNCLEQSADNQGIFDLYYNQVKLQNILQDLFFEIIEIGLITMRLIEKNQEKQEILHLLLEKNNLKQEISDKITEIGRVNTFKSIIYKFMLDYYFDNMPNVALNNLKLSNFESLISSQKNFNMLTLSKAQNSLRQQTEKIQDGEDKMILFVSGVQNFGRVTYSCPNFKTKMELSTDQTNFNDQKMNEKITIYSIMLPIWCQHHMNTTTNTSKTLNNVMSHEGTKYHMISNVEKIVYEISFKLHYIVKNMDDLWYGLDITSKEIQRLKIYKDSKLMFQNLREQNLSNTEKKLHSLMKNNLLGTRHNNKQKNVKELQRSVETIFGEKYQILRSYKYSEDEKIQMNHQKQKQALQLIFNEDHDPDHIKNEPSIEAIDYQTIIQEVQDSFAATKIENQIKVRYFSRTQMFFKSKLMILNFIHWLIPPLIITISLLMRNYAFDKQAVSYHIYQTKSIIELQFLLADTHLQNNLFHFHQLRHNENYKGSQGSSVIKIMAEDIFLDAYTLTKRQPIIHREFLEDNPLLNLAFQKMNPTRNTSTSFYYSSLVYEAGIQEHLNIIDLNSSNTSPISLLTNLSEFKAFSIKRFFDKFIHKFEEYANNQNNTHAIFGKIQDTQTSTYDFYKTFLTYFLISLVIVAFITAIQFVILYVDLEFNIQKMVFQLMNMKTAQILETISKYNEIKNLLENCKFNKPQKIIKKYRKVCISTQNLSRNQIYGQTNHLIQLQLGNKQINLSSSSSSSLNKKLPYSSRMKIFRVYLKEIMIFVLIVAIWETLLIFFIRQIINQVTLVEKVSSGNQKLAMVTGLSNEISLEVNYAISQLGDKKLNFRQNFKIYTQMEKLKIIESLQLDQQTFLNYTFGNICQLYPHLDNRPFYCETVSNISFAECIMTNQKHFQAIIRHVEKGEEIDFRKMNYHMRQIHKRLSILNWFTQHFFEVSHKHYIERKKDPTYWLNWLIVEMAVIIILLNWYSLKIYKKMQVFYRQIFSLYPAHQMIRMQAFKTYINRALGRQINLYTKEICF